MAVSAKKGEFESRVDQMEPLMNTFLQLKQDLESVATSNEQIEASFEPFGALVGLTRNYIEQDIDFLQYKSDVFEFGFSPVGNYALQLNKDDPIREIIDKATGDIIEKTMIMNSKFYKKSLHDIKNQAPKQAPQQAIDQSIDFS